ncbi:MAG: stage IV sporulation protein A [Lachnospiraceae bacterium]|nr:stage IV sporulation protein A [Lachnospiraceae bacterium]
MEGYHIYKDIQKRCGGEIYIGVVGPVRTGKSTFIKRFIDLMVLPNMEDIYSMERTRDELPQSAAGKTIMTTEPKFIPKEAVAVKLEDGIEAKVRLIDCVGYMVDGAAGHTEGEEERLVKTPWFDYEIPFTQAAEIGTKKVITDHSTIGMVVTADGSFGELSREAYIPAEQKTINELKKLGKPFIVLLNCQKPYSEPAGELAQKMREEYGVSVLPVNCEQLKKEDIARILSLVLQEFPVTEIDFSIPKWLEILPGDHWLKEHLIHAARTILEGAARVKEVTAQLEELCSEQLKEIRTEQVDLSNGTISLEMQVEPSYYYEVISDYTGLPIEGEYQLLQTLGQLAQLKKEYEQVQAALESVRYRGYGVVLPGREEIQLEDPVVIKHGNKYGVKMHAQAPAISLIRANIETEIAPIVGSQQQAEDLIAYINDSRNEEDGIWAANIFGKSVEQIVGDGMQAKVNQMTEDCQLKLQDTMQKIINDSNGGMICIII